MLQKLSVSSHSNPVSYTHLYVKLRCKNAILRVSGKEAGKNIPENMKLHNSLGIDIGSTTVKIAVLDSDNHILFADYERHYANIQETLALLLSRAKEKLGEMTVRASITGSGGLTLSRHLNIPFTQEVVAVATALQAYAPQTDVAIELGGEDAKIIYFTGGIDQRMNGICAGGTGRCV